MDRALVAFYPQNLVTILQIEVDLLIGKTSLQKKADMTGGQRVLHVGFKDLYGHV